MRKFFRNTLFKIPAVRNAARNAYMHAYMDAYSKAYAAASSGRLVSDWIADAGSINRDIKSGMRTIRNRVRDLWKNNDYVRGARTRFRTNIIGAEGFKLQMNVKFKNGNDDEHTNDLIEEAWKEWCERETFSMSGRVSFLEAQWLWMDQLKRDGEILFRCVPVNDLDKNRFGFSVELLETDLLDETYNDELPNGNVIIMGVELDQWRRPVAYHFRNNDVKNEATSFYYGNYSSRPRKRVSADEIIFYFDPEHSNQFRGMSHFAQSLLTFHDLQGYDQAAIVAARAGASKMGHYIKKLNGMQQDLDHDDEDEDAFYEDFAPGTARKLPEGWEFQGWDPTYPHEQYPAFVKQVLRRLASGLALSYNNWIGDLEGVNFGSLRGGTLDERDSWILQQSQIREGVAKPLFSKWLKRSLFVKAISESLYYTDYDRLNKPVFTGRRWSWIDPLKDVEASKLAIESFLTTHQDEVKKTSGKDFWEIINQQKKEYEAIIEVAALRKEAGLLKDQGNVNTGNDNQDNQDNTDNQGKSLIKKVS